MALHFSDWVHLQGQQAETNETQALWQLSKAARIVIGIGNSSRNRYSTRSSNKTSASHSN